MKSADLTFTAVFESSDEGGYVVTFPAIPDLVTQGETIEEARAMCPHPERLRAMSGPLVNFFGQYEGTNEKVSI